MEKIDWDSAPEGYPLWIHDLKPSRTLDQSGWHRDDGDRYTDESGRYWYKIDDGSYSVYQRPSPAWSAEGLPPVGVVCEYNARNKSGIGKELWCEVVIKYLSEWVIVFECTKAPVGHEESVGVELFGDIPSGLANRFRPIRTPEQIAANEREAAIRAIVYDLQDAENLSSLPSIANCLYVKGYRKP